MPHKAHKTHIHTYTDPDNRCLLVTTHTSTTEPPSQSSGTQRKGDKVRLTTQIVFK